MTMVMVAAAYHPPALHGAEHPTLLDRRYDHDSDRRLFLTGGGLLPDKSVT
jgi:hypothetical protein